MTYLLGIRSPEQLSVHYHRGAVFETFVASEIMKNAYHSGENSELYYWRDRSGNEVDFLIDRDFDLLPVEAKSGRTVASDWFDCLKTWRSFAGDRAKGGMLFYGGDNTYFRGDIAVTSWRRAGQIPKS